MVSAFQLSPPTSLVTRNEVLVAAFQLPPELGYSKDWSSQKVHELRYQLEIKGVEGLAARTAFEVDHEGYSFSVRRERRVSSLPMPPTSATR